MVSHDLLQLCTTRAKPRPKARDTIILSFQASSGGVGGAAGAGAGPRYFSAETRQDLLRVEAAWTANIVNSVIRLGVSCSNDSINCITDFKERRKLSFNRLRLLVVHLSLCVVNVLYKLLLNYVHINS